MANPPDPTGRQGPDKDRHFRTDHLQQNLARRSIRGGAVTLCAQGVKVVAQFGTIILLARMLSPNEFGTFAMVSVLLGVLELFKDMGLSSATVQRKEITDREVSTLFWLNVGLGTMAAIVLAAAAPLLAWFYDAPTLIEITPVVASTLILTGFAAQHLALLRRQMRFPALSGLQTTAEVLAMLAAIIAASNGLGIWALVAQRLTWGVATMLGAWLASGWRPSRPGRLGEVREMVAFGGNATGAMMLGRAASSVDKMLIGWYWGAAPLGLFERSQKLIMMPIQNVNVPLTSVALPMLSRLIDQPERYRKAYMAAVERVAMMVAPAAGLVIGGAGTLVDVLLGPKWHEAGPILTWMGVAAVYMPVTYTLSWLYMSQDRTGEMLRANIINVSLTLAAVVIALPYGPAMIAAAFATSGALIRSPIVFYLAGRRGPVTTRDFPRILMTPVLAAAAAASAVLAADHYAVGAAIEGPAHLALLAAAAVASALVVYGVVPRGRRALIETLRMPRMLIEKKVQQA